MVKVLWAPVSGQGESIGTLTQKSTFPNEFRAEMRTTNKVIQKNQNKAKNRKSDKRLQNGGQQPKFKLATLNFPPKMVKKTLSRRNFSIKFGSYLWIVSTITMLK